MITNKRIIIFGGSGSLGQTLINRLHKDNKIQVFSRDEAKHWTIKNKFNSEETLTNFARFLGEKNFSPKLFENDFEDVVIPAYPEIGLIKNKLIELGAKFASLSGSGSTVYGIFNNETSVKEAELFFQKSNMTILTEPTNNY